MTGGTGHYSPVEVLSAHLSLLLSCAEWKRDCFQKFYLIVFEVVLLSGIYNLIETRKLSLYQSQSILLLFFLALPIFFSFR